MIIIVTPEYHWCFGMLVVVPSGSVLLSHNDWPNKAIFVWWWPVNWIGWPIAKLIKLYYRFFG